jgi:hypothetical protein
MITQYFLNKMSGQSFFKKSTVHIFMNRCSILEYFLSCCYNNLRKESWVENRFTI